MGQQADICSKLQRSLCLIGQQIRELRDVLKSIRDSALVASASSGATATNFPSSSFRRPAVWRRAMTERAPVITGDVFGWPAEYATCDCSVVSSMPLRTATAERIFWQK